MIMSLSRQELMQLSTECKKTNKKIIDRQTSKEKIFRRMNESKDESIATAAVMEK